MSWTCFTAARNNNPTDAELLKARCIEGAEPQTRFDPPHWAFHHLGLLLLGLPWTCDFMQPQLIIADKKCLSDIPPDTRSPLLDRTQSQLTDLAGLGLRILADNNLIGLLPIYLTWGPFSATYFNMKTALQRNRNSTHPRNPRTP